MPALDDHMTPELRTLLAALSPTADDADLAAALSLIRGWAGHDLDETEDAGSTSLVSAASGIALGLDGHRARSMTFELMANRNFEPFSAPTRLVRGLDPAASPAALRALIGPPVESAYGNDSYLLDGVDAVLCLGWRSSGGLQRLMLLRTEPGELARLRRKQARTRAAAAAVDAAPVVVEVPEEDGILGIVDPDTYAASLPGWDFDSLTRHLESESGAGHGAFWRAGPAEFATYVITVRATASDQPAVRESEHVLRASRKRLRLVGWGTLTTAADATEERLDDEADAEVAAPATRVSVRIRQLAADPDADGVPVEIVLQSLGRRRTQPQPRLAWWED